MTRVLLLVCLILTANTALAAPHVRVVGLFPGAAVLSIDGQRKLLKVGQSSADVQLISADSRSAVLRVAGVERSYSLEREYRPSGYAEPSETPKELSIARSNNGHYMIAGSINGQSAQFMVDTGATSVAMNEAQARRLNIDYRTQGSPMTVSTAGGLVKGWNVMLNSVKLGNVEVLGVSATVVEGGFPTEILLGMSYLSRVSWREEQGLLRIQSKY